jgi:hypothetical protein
MFGTKFVENIKTHFMFNKLFSENHDVCEITWKNMVEADRPCVTIQRCVEKMLFGCRIT